MDIKLLKITPQKEVLDEKDDNYWFLNYQTDIIPETNEMICFNYSKQQDQQLITETTTNYQIKYQKTRVPKQKAEQVKQRIQSHIKQQLIDRKEGEEIQNDYLAPQEYIIKQLRTIQHQCPICGGPHQLSNCVLKSKRIDEQMQKLAQEGKSVDIYETMSYSIIISPIPDVWESRNVKQFVEEQLQNYKSYLVGLQVKIADLKDKIQTLQNNQEVEDKENENLPKEEHILRDELDKNDAFLYSPNLHVQFVAIPPQQNGKKPFCYVNFLNEDIARKASELIQGVLLENEKIYMNSEYRGRRIRRQQ